MLARRPGDWLAALRTLPNSLQALYASAFQSWLWNAWLSATVRTRFAAADCLDLPIERDLCVAPLAGCPAESLPPWLPYPSARNPAPEPELLALLQPALAVAELTWAQLKIDAPRSFCLPKGGRATTFQPMEPAVALDGEAARLRFFLPRGSYATIVLAWLAARVGDAPA